jgi:hypothetical protein
MDGLIEALMIFRQYRNVARPTHCEHDVLTISAVTRDEVSAEDQKRLNELGFVWSEAEDGCWRSYRYGSA